MSLKCFITGNDIGSILWNTQCLCSCANCEKYYKMLIRHEEEKMLFLGRKPEGVFAQRYKMIKHERHIRKVS